MPCKTIIKKATSKTVLQHWFNVMSKYAGKYKITGILRIKGKTIEGLHKYKIKFTLKNNKNKRVSKSDKKGNALGISWYSKKKGSGWEL